MTDKILTQHPQGKKGFRIDRHKYEVIQSAIIDLLKNRGTASLQMVVDTLVLNLENSFDGSIPWYVAIIKLDLEARGIIERIIGTTPQQLRLTALYKRKISHGSE